MQTETSTNQFKITRDTLGFSSVFNRLDATEINPATGQSEAEQSTNYGQLGKIRYCLKITKSRK